MAKLPIQEFTLSELIVSTSSELRVAHEQAKDKDAVMLFKGCDLELAVTLKGEAGGS
jgi:hypothetical protein